MVKLHAYAMAPSQPATKCSVSAFFIGGHPRNQEFGKGKSENKKSKNQEIGIRHEQILEEGRLPTLKDDLSEIESGTPRVPIVITKFEEKISH
jgi:hypothetical protein